MKFVRENDSSSTRPLRGGLALALAHGVQLAVPLFAVVYLGRVLGPGPWGEAAAALALGNVAVALPEFGFGYSAARAAAQARTPEARHAVLRGTLAARALLGLSALALVAAAVWLPALPPSPGPLAWAMLAYVAAHALALDWWFDGTERFERSAALAALARAPVPLLLVAFVHGPADAPLALWAYAVSGALALALALAWAVRDGAWGPVRRAWVAEALRQGRTLFASRAGLLVYLNGTVYWLRVLAGPVAAGLYVPAEQAARAACMALQPLSRVLLPSMSAETPEAHARRLRRVGAVYAGLGIALSAAVWTAAPLLPRLVGADFGPSVPVLRLLAPLPFFVALSQALAVQGLVARGHDRRLALSFLAGASVCVATMAVLVPRFEARGMAVAVVAAEAVVALVAGALWRSRPA